jgi:hypothetical protein
MYYIIYKTTNTLNGKWYIGFHSSKTLDDSYLGSGKLLLAAIKKYGRSSFTREILYVFPNKNEALLKEKELVNESVVTDPTSYNCKIGGEGGWDHIPNKLIEDPTFKEKMYTKVGESVKKAFKEGRLLPFPNSTRFTGKKHSTESKMKISKNNANTLSDDIISFRIADIKNDSGDKWLIKRLSLKWGVSHTQVRRFINKYMAHQSIQYGSLYSTNEL